MKTRVYLAFVLSLSMAVPALARHHRRGAKKATSPAYNVLIKGTQSGDMLARAIAMSALARFKTADTLKYVKDGLHDPQWIVRKEAIKTLYKLGKKAEALKALNDAITDPTLPWDQDYADIMLAFSRRDALRFTKAMLGNPKVQIKVKALKSLLSGGKEWVHFVAKQVLKGQSDAINMAKGVSADQAAMLLPLLYRTRNAAVANVVIDLAEKYKIAIPQKVLLSFGRLHDPKLRGRVALKLAKLGNPRATAIIKDFVKAKGPEHTLFLQVAALVPTRKVAKVIKKRFLNEKTPTRDLIYTLTALAKLHDKDAGRFAATGVNSTDLNVMIASVRTLPLFQGAMAMPTLKKQLFQGNQKVRLAAVQAIGDLARKDSEGTLQRALKEAYDPAMKLAIIHALDKLKDVSVVNTLSYHVYDANPKIKKAAILAIARVLDPKAAKLLRAFIEEPDPEIRLAVLRNLITVTPKVALSNFDRIVDGLDVSDIQALAHHFGKAFAPFVKAAIKSTVPFIRNVAFKCLDVVPLKDRKALLQKLVSVSDYPDVRKNALLNMAETSCRDACPLAQALLNDKDTGCRITAIRVTGLCCGKKARGQLQTIMTGPADIVAITAAATYANIPRRIPRSLKPASVDRWLHR